MKHTKTFIFIFALGTTCYVAYYSVQRNTLAPSQPLSTLTIATTEAKENQQGFTSDIIKDLSHRMTQKPIVHVCSVEKAIEDIKKGQTHCAILPRKLIKQEENLAITSLDNTQNPNVLVVSAHNPQLFKRTYATLLEMSEDGAINDFAHKWNLT